VKWYFWKSLRFKVNISFDSKPKSSSEGLKFFEAKITPFIIPISKERDKSKKYFCFFVKFGRIPGTYPGRIKEFAYDERVLRSRLIRLFSEMLENFFCQEFHMRLGLGHMKISLICIRKSWKNLRNFSKTTNRFSRSVFYESVGLCFWARVSFRVFAWRYWLYVSLFVRPFLQVFFQFFSVIPLFLLILPKLFACEFRQPVLFWNAWAQVE